MKIEIAAADREFACSLSNANLVLANYVMSGELENVDAKITETLTAIAKFRLQCVADYVAGQWQPIESAPFDTDVWVRVDGMQFKARRTIVSEGTCSYSQWLATVEGVHPPCWSDGAYWSSNENDDRSLPVLGWMLLDGAPMGDAA